MIVRKTFQWSVFLVAVLAAGGWYALRLGFDHKDRLVLEGIRKEVARTVPDWHVEIGDARIDLQGRVLLTDVSITPDAAQPPLVRIPKCLVMLDTDLLFGEKRVLVRSVRVINPQVLAARDEHGVWNWQGLSQPKPSEQTPEVTIEQGQLLVRIAAGSGLPQTEVGSRDINLRLVPAGRRRYVIDCASEIDGAGALRFGGEIDLNTRAWRLAGRADEVDMSQGLLEKAAAIAPDVGRKVAELSGGSSSRTGETAHVPARTLPTGTMTGSTVPAEVQTVSLTHSMPTGQLRLPNLGLSASVGVEFDLLSDGTQAIPDYRVIARVVNGTVGEPLSPVPLSNLRGDFYLENNRQVVRDLSASNGASQLSLSGELRQIDGRTLRDFEVAATNLLIDDELRHLLPPGAQRLFDRIQPAGLFTIRGRFRGDDISTPQVRLDEFTAIDCSMRHELFPYPVTGITGTIRQEDETLVLDLQGQASQRPITITGRVENPGPNAAATLDVVVDDLPLDEQFIDSLVDPRQQGLRRAIEEMKLTGQMDLRVRIMREAGAGQPTLMGVDADLSRGTLDFSRFPYSVTAVSGHLHFNPWQEKVWRFTRLQGQHDQVVLTGAGAFDLERTAVGRLDLTLSARNLPLDRDLHRATTTASPALHDVWVAVNPDPRSIAHCEGIELSWVPGQSPTIEVPSIVIPQASVTLAAFPFRWDHVAAELSWKDNRVAIRRATARHQETHLKIEGRGDGAAAYFEMLPDGADGTWELRLEDVKVRNLDPGGELRQALPGDVAAVASQLDPRGPIDADLAFEMKGFADPRGGPDFVTAHWQVTSNLTRDRLSVGLDLTDVSGTIEADVLWDGQRASVDGWLELSEAHALDMTLSDIRGPFSVDDNRVTVGSAIMLQRAPPGMPQPQVPPDEQLTARLCSGTVELSAQALLHPTDSEQTAYQALLEVKNADLSQWADEWGYAGLNVAGTTRAHLELQGRGSSELGLQGKDCWMQISDARLGELPVIAQMLTQVVAPQQRDKTAFRYAYLDFSIHDGVFDFGPLRGRPPQDTRRIQLVGDALKMIGQGYLPFAPQVDPNMNLDFYSKADQRNPLLAIPIVGPLAKSISDNWIHVRVSGTPSAPRIRTQTEVPVDNALREFFGAFETGLIPTLPR